MNDAIPARERPVRGYENQKQATGLTVGVLKAMHKLSKGTPECPWRGQFASPDAILRWFKSNPEFVPSRAWDQHLESQPR
jgi:hypothetical protein